MGRSRLVHAVVGVACVLALGATAGCSGDEDDGAGAPAGPARTGPSPTAVGDAPVVRLLSAGAEPRAALRLAPETGASVTSQVRIEQQLLRDDAPVEVPTLTMRVTTTVDGVDGDRLELGQSFADVTSAASVSGAGAAAADVLDGTSGRVVTASDGVVLEAALDLPAGVDAATRRTVDGLRDQVVALTPVLPAEPVGEGASWSVESVVPVGGVPALQTATYTLEALTEDAYVIGYALSQDYRPGEVGGVTVTQGTASAAGRLEGSLGEVVPRRAVGSSSATVGYRVAGAVTIVASSVRVDLTTS